MGLFRSQTLVAWQHYCTGIEHESLTITPSLNRFYYFSGDFGGDTIKFAREMMGIIDFNGDQGFNYLNGMPKNLKFFEAPIDMLSYMSIHQSSSDKINDTWFVSMGGLKESVVQNYVREAQGRLAKFAVNQMLQSVDGDVATAYVVFKEKDVTPESIKDVLEKAGLSHDNYGTIQDYVNT